MLYVISESLFDYVTTMVCVAVKGEPIIGIIHNPFTKQTVWAWKNEAVSESIRKILLNSNTITSTAVIRNPLFIVSRSHTGKVEEFIKKKFGGNSAIIKAAGAGYKVLQVIFNNASAYIHLTNIKKWDICAGHAILGALGGAMTTLYNEPINYGSSENALNERGLLASLNHHTYLMSRIVDSDTILGKLVK